jgi:hypothetical protein
MGTGSRYSTPFFCLCKAPTGHAARSQITIIEISHNFGPKEKADCVFRINVGLEIHFNRIVDRPIITRWSIAWDEALALDVANEYGVVINVHP